jgi:hypothetical protein
LLLLCAGLAVLGNDTKFHFFWPVQPFVTHRGTWTCGENVCHVGDRSRLASPTPTTFSVCVALGSQGIMDWIQLYFYEVVRLISYLVKGLYSSFFFMVEVLG